MVGLLTSTDTKSCKPWRWYIEIRALAHYHQKLTDDILRLIVFNEAIRIFIRLELCQHWFCHWINARQHAIILTNGDPAYIHYKYRLKTEARDESREEIFLRNTFLLSFGSVRNEQAPRSWSSMIQLWGALSTKICRVPCIIMHYKYIILSSIITCFPIWHSV